MIPLPEFYGSSKPRLGATRSDRPTLGHAAETICEVIGQPLLDWQSYALDVGLETEAGKWAYPDVGIAVARQNGKTVILHSRIYCGLLLWGESILHTAQNRELPRESFLEIANVLQTYFPSEVASIRYANGQEVIRMNNGGIYRILASRPDAPRGHHADLLILDEVREFNDHEFIGAIMPTLNTSRNPQVWWASNAGDPDSVVLNRLRERGLTGDKSLAWMEWSADPALASDDPVAWAQANPSLGFLIDQFRIEHLSDTLTAEAFETEVLCRWVEISGTRAISPALWDAALDADLQGSDKVVVSIDIDIDRAAAAVAAAWKLSDGRTGTDLLLYRTGDLTTLEVDVEGILSDLRPQIVGFDPWTGSVMAETLGSRGFPMKPVTGRDWVSACGTFLETIQNGNLRHPGRSALSEQLAFAGRKETVEGRWWITRGSEPIPAVTATARAVYLATKPRPLYAVF
jgi:phage terminase large subunit-like protein